MLPQPKTENARPDPRRGCTGIGDPAAEPRGVVRRVAVVGRADHNQGSFVRQLARVIIQSTQGHGIATIRTILGDAGGNSLGGAEVGPEQHHERGVVSLPGPLRTRLRLSGLPVGRRGGDRDRGGARGSAWPLLDLDQQAVGLDRQTLFDLQLDSSGSRRSRSVAAACRARASPPASRTGGRCRPADPNRTA